MKGELKMLTPHDSEIIGEIVQEQRISIQAAAYTIYVQLTPNNKKPLSQREFHREFMDNWQAFQLLESEESSET